MPATLRTGAAPALALAAAALAAWPPRRIAGAATAAPFGRSPRVIQPGGVVVVGSVHRFLSCHRDGRVAALVTRAVGDHAGREAAGEPRLLHQRAVAADRRALRGFQREGGSAAGGGRNGRVGEAAGRARRLGEGAGRRVARAHGDRAAGERGDVDGVAVGTDRDRVRSAQRECPRAAAGARQGDAAGGAGGLGQALGLRVAREDRDRERVRADEGSGTTQRACRGAVRLRLRRKAAGAAGKLGERAERRDRLAGADRGRRRDSAGGEDQREEEEGGSACERDRKATPAPDH